MSESGVPGLHDERAEGRAGAFDSLEPPAKALLDRCVHCGFCLPTCPTYLLWNEEMDSPRGRIHLMRAGLEGRLDMSDAFVRHFDTCLGCMACVTACPSGVEYGPLVEATRAQIERRFERRPADRLFRRLLFEVVTSPERLRQAAALLRPYGRIRPWLERAGLLDLLPPRLRAAARLAPAVSNGRPPAEVPERTVPEGPAEMTVGLLTGCVQRVFFGRVNQATVEVLSKAGCEVRAPREQGCCGALALHAGLVDEARGHARALIDTFERAGVDRVVANVAGCGSAMKEYGHLLAGDPDWAPRAKAFASKVQDVSETLAGLPGFRVPLRPLRLRVAYHDACHLAHGQGVRQPPRELLRRIPGLTLVPLEESEICCGSAGIYNLVEPEAADELGARKVRHIAAAAPDVVATGNAGCLLQIAGAAARAGHRWPVLHPIELLRASLTPDRG